MNKFTTKNGKGVVCYRIPHRRNGKVVYGADYMRRIKRGGRQFYFKLGPEKRMAEAISNEIDTFLRDPRNSIEQAIRQFNPDSIMFDRGRLTIRDIIQHHKEAEPILELKPSVAKHYRSSLMWVVRRVMAHRSGKLMPKSLSYDKSLEVVSGFPVHQLNVRLISDLKLAEMKAAEGSLVDQAAVKRRLKSIMADARSVFSAAALREYHNQGLELPELESFLKATIFNRVSKKRYRLPASEVIERIHADRAELRKDLNMYRIFLLAIGAGLRRAEIINCRQDWIVGGKTPQINLGVTDDWEQKGHGEGTTELCEWTYKELMNCMEPGDRILTGTMTDGEAAARNLATWLRSKGLDRAKPVHELRMLFGSWVSNRRGLYVAQKLLRHKSAQITSDSYADLISDESVMLHWDSETDKAARIAKDEEAARIVKKAAKKKAKKSAKKKAS